MNTNKQKNYLVIKNVCSNKNLIEYLEQVCQDENVSILYEEFNQFDLLNGKQSVYASFNAKNGSDMLLWSYDSIKLDYVNYLYTDFETRYRNAGKVIDRIIEKVSDFDEDGELVDRAIRDALSSGWTINWTFSNCKSNLNSEQERNLREKLASFATGDWSIVKLKNTPTFKQKISNFYNKHVDKIIYLLCGLTLSNIFFIAVLTLKHFMIK